MIYFTWWIKIDYYISCAFLHHMKGIYILCESMNWISISILYHIYVSLIKFYQNISFLNTLSTAYVLCSKSTI